MYLHARGQEITAKTLAMYYVLSVQVAFTIDNRWYIVSKNESSHVVNAYYMTYLPNM